MKWWARKPTGDRSLGGLERLSPTSNSGRCWESNWSLPVAALKEQTTPIYANTARQPGKIFACHNFLGHRNVKTPQTRRRQKHLVLDGASDERGKLEALHYLYLDANKKNVIVLHNGMRNSGVTSPIRRTFICYALNRLEFDARQRHDQQIDLLSGPEFSSIALSSSFSCKGNG
jgi:hypothetical protein